jgi:hypothetical protein
VRIVRWCHGGGGLVEEERTSLGQQSQRSLPYRMQMHTELIMCTIHYDYTGTGKQRNRAVVWSRWNGKEAGGTENLRPGASLFDRRGCSECIKERWPRSLSGRPNKCGGTYHASSCVSPQGPGPSGQYKGMYNLDTAARYSKYKIQLKHNIIQWSCLKHVSYDIHCTN